MCTLAHVFESHGIATIALPSNRSIAERMRPPRALYCEFPLGRPLGRPDDPDLQHRVLRRAFALLDEPAGPVMQDFDVVITDQADVPAACPLPPRYDSAEPEPVAEARGLRAAWDRAVGRSGRSQVGRVVEVDEIPEAVGRFVRMEDGAWWDEAGFASELEMLTAALDVRAYYEEAALGLLDHVPEARAAEAWYYRRTATGRLMHEVASRIRQGDRRFTYRRGTSYLVPSSQVPPGWHPD